MFSASSSARFALGSAPTERVRAVECAETGSIIFAQVYSARRMLPGTSTSVRLRTPVRCSRSYPPGFMARRRWFHRPSQPRRGHRQSRWLLPPTGPAMAVLSLPSTIATLLSPMTCWTKSLIPPAVAVLPSPVTVAVSAVTRCFLVQLGHIRFGVDVGQNDLINDRGNCQKRHRWAKLGEHHQFNSSPNRCRDGSTTTRTWQFRLPKVRAAFPDASWEAAAPPPPRGLGSRPQP